MHPKLRRYVEPRARAWPLFAVGFGLTVLAGVTALEMDTQTPYAKDPVAVAHAVVTVFADVAYPHWVAEHPDRPLATLDELCAYTNRKVAIDPWGERYLMIPTEAAIIVGSMGPDQKLGTSDDIWSSQP